jgi:hypothetical protein
VRKKADTEQFFRGYLKKCVWNVEPPSVKNSSAWLTVQSYLKNKSTRNHIKFENGIY